MARFDEEIEQLLSAYGEYRSILAERETIARRLAKQKLAGSKNPDDERYYRQLTDDLQGISDSMTFSSPRAWLVYKHRAYANESQPIHTMHDLRMHCSVPGYICTKRFIFLNTALEHLGRKGLNHQDVYPDDMLLSEVLESDVIGAFENDSSAMKEWREHEYFHIDGRAAKWADVKESADMTSLEHVTTS